jgi:hypothetical protein
VQPDLGNQRHRPEFGAAPDNLRRVQFRLEAVDHIRSRIIALTGWTAAAL